MEKVLMEAVIRLRSAEKAAANSDCGPVRSNEVIHHEEYVVEDGPCNV